MEMIRSYGLPSTQLHGPNDSAETVSQPELWKAPRYASSRDFDRIQKTFGVGGSLI